VVQVPEYAGGGQQLAIAKQSLCLQEACGVECHLMLVVYKEGVSGSLFGGACLCYRGVIGAAD
jgi:hypothetical protein